MSMATDRSPSLPLPRELLDDPAPATTRRGLSEEEARARLHRTGPNRFVPRARFARLRELARMLADPQALLLAAGALIYFALRDSRDAIILALALIPVLAVDVVL